MELDPQLVAMLACPICRVPVVPEGGEDGGLACGSCGRVYPVEDGIPQMLPDRARPGKPAGGP